MTILDDLIGYAFWGLVFLCREVVWWAVPLAVGFMICWAAMDLGHR